MRYKFLFSMCAIGTFAIVLIAAENSLSKLTVPYVKTIATSQQTPKNNSGKATIDTLSAELIGSLALVASGYRASFKATKFTPAGECSVMQFLWGVGTQTASASKPCSFYVWSDGGATPGSRLHNQAATMNSGVAGEIYWNSYTLSSPLYVTGAFWAGGRELSESYPTTLCDMAMSFPSQYSRYGTSWSADTGAMFGDFFHKVVVKYTTGDNVAISVSPTQLDFHIDSTPGAYGCKAYNEQKLIEFAHTAISMDDPKYWEEAIPGEIIIGYKNTIDIHKASLAELGIAQEKGTILKEKAMYSNYILVDVAGDAKDFIKRMQAKSNVAFAEPNRMMKLQFTPNDPRWGNQWDKKTLKCPEAWDIEMGSMKVAIGIIDIGTDYNHPDLAAHFTSTKGYDFDGSDDDPFPSGTYWHGTHCSGTAASVINNSVGIAGISNSQLYALKAGQTGVDVYAGSNSVDWCVANNAKIISMSWGGAGGTALQNSCDNAWAAGCILCGATGNDGVGSVINPAAYASVIAVGATDQSDVIASFSNYGAATELAAPGVAIDAPELNSGYYTSDGTSMACPQVAGCAALLWEANPNLSNDNIRDILASTAIDLGTTGRDQYYGYGRPDLQQAVLTAKSMDVPCDTATITVYNSSSASTDLSVSSIGKSQKWILYISETNFTVSPGNSKNLTIIVGARLAAGIYYDTLRIYSNDPENSPLLVPITLYATGHAVEEGKKQEGLITIQMTPNPAGNTAKITYLLTKNSTVTMKIYDATGRLLNSPILNKTRDAGLHSINMNTKTFSPGIYFVKFYAKEEDGKELNATRKLILTR